MRLRTLSAGLAGVLVTGLALAPLTTSAASAAPAAAAVSAARAAAPAVPTPPAVSWGTCTRTIAGDYAKALRGSGGECGLLTVPLDYADPAAGTIQLAVSRILHTTKRSKGAVFTNPGGPGGSGTYLPLVNRSVPKKAGLSYDWYGVDPRGVGHSVPALGCDPSIVKPGSQPVRPTTTAIESYWVTKASDYATACADSPARALLPHLKTTDNVMDFESLRLAIGQPQITWYGYSYGTQIGQYYATMYPASIKAMILDGVVDTSRDGYQAYNYDQDVAFQVVFKKFEKWISKYDELYDLGSTRRQVDRTWTKLTEVLARKPVKKIGTAELTSVVASALYYNGAWPDTAQALSALVNDGDVRPVKKAFRTTPEKGVPIDNGTAVYNATGCTDSPWPTDYATWKADSTATDARAPFETWSNTWFNLPCRTWSVPGSAQLQVTGAFTGPVLLLSETFDPATPISGALNARSVFPNSALVEGKGGTSHAVSLSGIACTDDTIATLLKKGTLPQRKAGVRADKRCAPLEAPDPTATEQGSGRRAVESRPVIGVR